MRNLKGNLFNPFFSHIYVENKAWNYPIAQKVLEHFNNSKIVKINHYKDVFSRGHQDYAMQKNSPKLILAVKENNLIYEGAPVCENFGNKHFYYTSIMMNCIYDCEYCYLQGMYSTANVVLFVNIDDYFTEVEGLLKKHSVYLSISYDTDILAFENIFGYTREWMKFAQSHGELTIEIRTKSANFKAIEDIKSCENIILSWTLSPDEVVNQYEHKAPSLQERILNIQAAIDKGWLVRLCFDPLIYSSEWKTQY